MKTPLSLVSRAAYVRELRAELPADVFQPARSRLAWIPVHLSVIVVATIAIADGWLPWFVTPLLSLVIGASFAGLTFIAHEAGHGGICTGRTARTLVTWIGFLPFTVSPRLWANWHDRVHHANANSSGDPDAYPSLEEYQASGRIRLFIDAFSPGNRRWRGVLSLMFGFTGQSLNQLVVARRFMKPRAYRLAIVDTLVGIAVWVVVASLVGFVPFLFVFVAPLLVANTIVMSFILTNHTLNPRVAINDPLVSGLSVSAPRWVEWVTLHFGYHVEHHLFPAMSARHAPSVRTVLLRLWPERYQSMSLRSALRRLHETARVYKDDVTLIDPRTGREFPTLVPGPVDSSVSAG